MDSDINGFGQFLRFFFVWLLPLLIQQTEDDRWQNRDDDWINEIIISTPNGTLLERERFGDSDMTSAVFGRNLNFYDAMMQNSRGIDGDYQYAAIPAWMQTKYCTSWGIQMCRCTNFQVFFSVQDEVSNRSFEYVKIIRMTSSEMQV